jgi:ABC-type uncharacterized transport system ATPase subunit
MDFLSGMAKTNGRMMIQIKIKASKTEEILYSRKGLFRKSQRREMHRALEEEVKS